MKELLNLLGLDSNEFAKEQERLIEKATTYWDHFVKIGGFGIPTIFYKQEPFWGATQIPFLLEKMGP